MKTLRWAIGQWLWVGMLCGVLVTSVTDMADAEEASPLDKALVQWRKDGKRKPLHIRCLAMAELATTRAPEARKILIERYRKPRAPKAAERYVIAALLGQYFKTVEDRVALRALVAKQALDSDAWLHFWVHRSAALAADHEEVLDRARAREGSPFLRSAAIQSLCGRPAAEALRAVLPILVESPGTDRLADSLRVEAVAAVLLAHRAEMGKPLFQAAALKLVDQLRRTDLADRTRLVIARYLGAIHEVDTVTFDPEYWESVVKLILERARPEATIARPTFAKLEAVGHRVAYLIDMSDSMKERLTAAERAAVRRDHTGIQLDYSATRFDLARKLLEASLHKLADDMEFVVIGFGVRTQVIGATRSLQRASRRNVDRVLIELDLVGGSSLGGWATNLHGALLRAFRVTEGRTLKADEHVAPKGFDRGCDTIFILSDGAPNWGDFPCREKVPAGTELIHPDTGATYVTQKAANALWPCIYADAHNLLLDVQRLNLFRKVEIHCVGTGAASPQFLQLLATLGLGRTRIVGAKTGN